MIVQRTILRTSWSVRNSQDVSYQHVSSSHVIRVLLIPHPFSLCSVDGMKKCTEEDLPEDAKFPMVWDWLKDATYHRFEDPRTKKTYDAWSVHVSVALSAPFQH